MKKLKPKKKKNIELDFNQRVQSLLENTVDGFALYKIICDPEGNPVDYRFLKVNRAFEKLTGLKEKDIKNCTVKEIFPKMERSWIEKCGEVALKNKSFFFENYSLDLKKHFNVKIHSPPKYQFVTLLSEISDEVQGKEITKRERNFFETILNNVSFGYWDWDIRHKQKYISPSYKAMLGYSVDELSNSPDIWKVLIHEEDIPRLLKCCSNILIVLEQLFFLVSRDIIIKMGIRSG